MVDPVKVESRGIIRLAESFLVHNAPLRVGLVLAVDPNPKLSGRDDAGVAMLCAFNYVAQKNGKPADALSFITDLYAVVGDGVSDQPSLKVVHVGPLLTLCVM